MRKQAFPLSRKLWRRFPLRLSVVLTLGFIFSQLSGAGFNTSLASVKSTAEETTHIQPGRKGIVIRPNEVPPFRIKTIVIDAGHGGHDPGCSGANSTEKHIALSVAQKFAAAIRQQFPDMQVILTRDKDVFIPLYERAAIANRAHADLFVSIHCNAMPTRSPTSGSETYVMGLHTAAHNLNVAKRENNAILLEENYERNYDYDPNSPEGHILLSMFQNAFLEQSILFAEKVEHHFEATAQRRSRGVKQAGFVVLKETAMPSVLVETGFLSSSQDEAFLLTEEGQDQVARALFNAFAEYKASIEGDNLAALPPVAVASTPAPTSPASSNFNTPPTNSRPSLPVEVRAAPATSTPPAYEIAQTPPAPVAVPVVNRNYAPPNPTVVQAQAEPVIAPASHNDQGTISSRIPARERGLEPKGGQTTNWAANLGQSNSIIYGVQLAAAPNPLNTQDPLWMSSNYLIEVVQEDQMFKYQVRNLKNMETAFATRLALQNQGFRDAFIVAYYQGKRISMAEARQLSGE